MNGDPEPLRWLALAIAPEKLPAALAALNGERSLAQIFPQAAILHLYPDGGQDRIPVAQIELLLQAARIPHLLDRLRAAAVLDPAPDRAVLIRPLAAGPRDCIVLPAPATAPYAQIVRWRGPRGEWREER